MATALKVLQQRATLWQLLQLARMERQQQRIFLLDSIRVVEVEAPYGYVLNPNEQKVTFTYVDDKTPVIKESLTFSDDRQKLDMSVTKLDSEDNTPIAGAVFGLYADEDIKNVDGKVIIEKGHTS